MRQIDSQTVNGGGAIPLLQNRIADPRFAVFCIVIELLISFTNADALLSKTVKAEDFCKATKVDLFYRDGRPWLKNMDLVALELLEQRKTQGHFGALSECTDRSIAAATTETHKFRVGLRLYDAFAADPETFVQSLSNVGNATCTVGGTGNASVTVSKSIVNVHVEGMTKAHALIGARQVYAVRPMTLDTEQQIALGGGSLTDLIALTYDDVAEPIAMTGPTIAVDEQPALVNEPLRNVVELDAIRGSYGEGRMTAAGTPQLDRTYTRAAALYSARRGASISDLSRGEFVTASYNTQPNVTSGAQAYILGVIIDNPRDSVRQIVPGMATKSDRVLAGATITRQSHAGTLEPELEARLPFKFYPADAGAAAAA
jgi:hypothetical protein